MAELWQNVDMSSSNDPTSPDYVKRAAGLYANQQIAPYQAAVRRIQQNMSNRGMLDSGLAAQGAQQLEQQRAQELGAFTGQQVQQQGALQYQAGEAEKQRKLAEQMQQSQFAQQNELYRKQQEAQNQMMQGQLIGQLLGGGGQIIGSMVGGPLAGYVGGKLGNALGVKANDAGVYQPVK